MAGAIARVGEEHDEIIDEIGVGPSHDLLGSSQG